MSHAPAPAPSIDPELKTLLRRVKLGRCLDTLPERLALARAEHLPHAEFLQLVLADEVDRRDRASAELRARAAARPHRARDLPPDTGVRFDRQLWHELCSLRFSTTPAASPGPVEVGKTTWPPPSDTSQSGVGARSGSPAPTSCSAGSRPPG